ncbi:unnamed protein product [Cunninghamella blakesleeana]
MYSSSNGKQLSPLPDLDNHHLPPQEPLKRKYEQVKKHRERNQNHPYKIDDDNSNTISSPSSPSSSTIISNNNHTSMIPSTSSLANKPKSSGRGKKPPHELLSEAQKKANHIASEQKRRANIRIGFDQLVDIVPTLSHCHRSESLILQKSYDYIQQLIDTKANLKERVRELQIVLGDIPDEDSSEEDDEFRR